MTYLYHSNLLMWRSCFWRNF